MSIINIEQENILAAAHQLAEAGAIAASPIRAEEYVAFSLTLTAAADKYLSELSVACSMLSTCYFNHAESAAGFLGAYETLDVELAARTDRLVYAYTQDTWKGLS